MANNESDDKKTGTRVFKKTSPNGKITTYLGKRDFIDRGDYVDLIDGMVLVDEETVREGRRVTATLLAAFRYGREDLDVLGLTFRKDLISQQYQVYPPNPSQPSRPLTRLQERLKRKLGDLAFPFWFEVPPRSASSVTLQFQPAPGDTGKPCGVDYELKTVVGGVDSNTNDRQLRNSSVRLAIRKLTYAPWEARPQPTADVSKDFMMSAGLLHMEASLDKEMHPRRSEGLKTAIAFCCLMLSAFLNFFLLTVIHDVVPRQPLPDLTFMLIPQQKWAWSVGDVLSTVSSVIAFTVVLLHHERWVVLRRMFLLGAIMYGLRAVVLGVTFLPPSFHDRDEICLSQVNRSAMYGMEIATRFLTYVVTLGLTSGQEKILCGDLMFSGHTVVLTIMYFVQLQYTPKGLVWLRYLAAPITFLGISALVVSGGHYTMDVLIAYWLTSHVFWAYHQMFEMPKKDRPDAPMSRLWWFWLCYWFESDVGEGRLDNHWNWPFEEPQAMHDIMRRLNRMLE